MSLRSRLVAAPLAAGLALGLAALPAPSAQASHADPAVPGPFAHTYLEYDAGPAVAGADPVLPAYPEDLLGSIHLPTGTGPFPVVLIEHGRHSTCAYAGMEQLGWPCPDTAATRNVRSYRGYDYLGRNLASHGYLVVSVSANAVNTYDTATPDAGATARAQVIDRTLDKLAEWNATAGPGAVGTALVGKVDLSRIGLMGHSRGGEGVTRFIGYNRTTLGGKWPVRAVFALAATDFGLPPSDGVHFGTLLPLCDGDVSDLQGANAWDRGRYTDPGSPYARVQWTVSGANHNFFNTVWTFDDWDFRATSDTACNATAPGRLTQTDQRRVGLALAAGFMRRYVGDETAFDGLMTGGDPLPSSACPGGTGTCPSLVRTSYLAPAPARKVVVVPTSTTTTATGQAVTTTGLTGYRMCTGNTGGTNGCPTVPNRSSAQQLVLRWTGAATFRAGVSATGLDVGGYDTLTFRTAVNFTDALNATAQQSVQVVLVDATGATSPAVTVSGPALRAPDGSAHRQVTLNGARAALSSFTGVDKTRITAIELRFGTATASGSIQLADLAFQDA